MQDASAIDSLDAILARHPFGNTDYIHQQLHICYKRRLHKISQRLPAAGRLLRELEQVGPYAQYRTLGDTVVRCAVQHAMRQIETGAPYGLPLERCEEILRAAAGDLAVRCGPLGSGLTHRLGPEPYHGWIWSEDRAAPARDDVFVRSFLTLLHDNYGETQLCTPESDELAMLSRGVRLLGELVPRCARSTLSHAHVIAVFAPVGDWTTRASSSQFRLSGTFFLSRGRLASPWWLAEHMFHEALHQQMYDFRHGHSLLVPTYGERPGVQVCSLWNLPNPSRSNYWDTDRVLAAFHVYVHLALLCTVAEQRAPELSAVYGPLDKMTGRRDALARAHYLAEQLRTACWDELGLAGRRFVDWFGSVLDALDPSPPPPGACVHLLLDRYRREAREVDTLQRSRAPSPERSRSLAALAREEAGTARRVLTAVDAAAARDRLEGALAEFPEDDLADHFLKVRVAISRALLDASPSGYGWAHDPRKLDEMVRQQIEHSSAALMSFLTGT
jgi:hypothetical protein